ncbi:hypothetical protein [Nonomuraea monospora]
MTGTEFGTAGHRHGQDLSVTDTDFVIEPGQQDIVMDRTSA